MRENERIATIAENYVTAQETAQETRAVPAARERICSNCQSDLENPVALECGHTFCKDCILRAVVEFNHDCCLDCRNPISPEWIDTFREMQRGAANRPEPIRPQEPRYRDYRNNPSSSTGPALGPATGPVASHPSPANLHDVDNEVEASIWHRVTEMNNRTGPWALRGVLQYSKCKQALWAHDFPAATYEDISSLFAELEFKRRTVWEPNSFVCKALRNMGLKKLAMQARAKAGVNIAPMRPAHVSTPTNPPEDSIWVRQHIERITPATPANPPDVFVPRQQEHWGLDTPLEPRPLAPPSEHTATGWPPAGPIPGPPPLTLLQELADALVTGRGMDGRDGLEDLTMSDTEI